MQNKDLTKWLRMVWDALAEQDESRRNTMLRRADMFLKDNNHNYVSRGEILLRRKERSTPTRNESSLSLPPSGAGLAPRCCHGQ
jgi:hypothetical protein